MRVLYFSKGYTPHDKRFLLEYAANGVDVSFANLDGWKGARPAGLPSGIRSFRLGRADIEGPRDCVGLVPAFQRLVGRLRPQVIHAGPVPLAGFLAALAGGAPLAAMSWGSDLLVDADRDPFWNSAAKYALGRASLFVCDCDAVRRKAAAMAAAPGRRVVQFPWGVDLERFRPAERPSGLRKEWGWEGKTVLISTRSWEPIYGIDVLVKGFRRAHARNKDVRLLLLGGGSLRTEIRNLVRRSGLRNACRFAGTVPEERIADYFRAADVYVAASRSDGASVSLLQAMACGLPAVVTDIPGNREWVAPGRGGELFPAGDDAALAQKIGRVIGWRAADRARAVRANRRRIERRADWPRNFKKLIVALKETASHAR